MSSICDPAAQTLRVACLALNHTREEHEKQRAQGMQAFAELVRSAEHYDLQINHATRWQDVGMRLADIARADSAMQGQSVQHQSVIQAVVNNSNTAAGCKTWQLYLSRLFNCERHASFQVRESRQLAVRQRYAVNCCVLQINATDGIAYQQRQQTAVQTNVVRHGSLDLSGDA